jgi:glycosyltransferase involved in cell wall biosynthesis
LTKDIRLSVVIPSAAAPEVFEEVLVSLFRQDPPPFEVILVDDAMDAGAYSIAQRCGSGQPLRIIKNAAKGVSAARNTGVAESRGEVILFIDTDVVLKPGSIKVILNTFSGHSECDGLVGVQSADLRFSDFFSRWKNHWMRFTYLRLKGPVHLFYTSCAAIRKDIFQSSGGFDESYSMPSIEDTAFGAVLGRMGARIFPCPECEVEHVKSYSFMSVLRTDFKRSAALVKYTLRNLLHGHGFSAEKTSVPGSFIAGAVIMVLFWISIIPAIAVHPSWFIAAFLSISGLWLVNAAWLRYLLKEEGVMFLIGAAGFLPVDVTVVIGGMLKGCLDFLFGSRY